MLPLAEEEVVVDVEAARPPLPHLQRLRPLQCLLYPEEEGAADKAARERIPQPRRRRSSWHNLFSIPTPWLLLRTDTSS